MGSNRVVQRFLLVQPIVGTECHAIRILHEVGSLQTLLASLLVLLFILTGTVVSQDDLLLDDVEIPQRESPAPPNTEHMTPPHPPLLQPPSEIEHDTTDLNLNATKDLVPLPVDTEDPRALARALSQRMRIAASLATAHGKTPDAVAVQDSVVNDLEKFLARITRAGESGGLASSEGPGTTRAGESGSGSSGSPRGGQGRSQGEMVGSAATNLPTPNGAIERIRQIWGHLPPREVGRIPSGAGIEYVPRFELLIRDYYRRLAEIPATDDPVSHSALPADQ